MQMNDSPKFSLEKAIEILKITPKILVETLQNHPQSLIFSKEEYNSWSPFDIVGHLIYADETDWIPRINIILSNAENKTFHTFDRFAQFEKNKNKSLDHLLKEFMEIRKIKIEELIKMNVTKEKLSLKGNHPELGEVTLQQLIATWTVHDLSHIAQILRIFAKQYKSEVGPWIEYLRILN